MAETLESIAGLFGFGDKQPNQPARFAEVTAVSGDTVAVTVGASTVDAVRCCDCAPGDVVLLETMPNGTLAAVAVKGYNGGGGGVQSVTIGTVSGATFTDSGTAQDPVLNLAVAIPTFEIKSSGTHAHGQSGYSYTTYKHDSGLLVATFSQNYTAHTGSAYNNAYYFSQTFNMPSAEDSTAPAFVSVPYVIAQPRASTGLPSITIYSLSATSAACWIFADAAAIPAGAVDFVAVGRWA